MYQGGSSRFRRRVSFFPWGGGGRVVPGQSRATRREARRSRPRGGSLHGGVAVVLRGGQLGPGRPPSAGVSAAPSEPGACFLGPPGGAVRGGPTDPLRLFPLRRPDLAARLRGRRQGGRGRGRRE